jgi:hypothetical protein
MRVADIANLTVLIGPVNPLFAQVFEGRASDDPPSLAECLQVTLSDFELGWNLASSFAAAARPLPDFVLSPSIYNLSPSCTFFFEPRRLLCPVQILSSFRGSWVRFHDWLAVEPEI